MVRSTGTGLCSGSFIAVNFALTASHCLTPDPHLINSIGLLVGTVDRSQPGGTSMASAEFWWHPQPATLVDDIALIRTTANLPNNPNVGFIRIPTRAQTNSAFHGPVVNFKIIKKI
jgi:secreted trypsin-like serine protease